jgi:hypothetical protein
MRVPATLTTTFKKEVRTVTGVSSGVETLGEVVRDHLGS